MSKNNHPYTEHNTKYIKAPFNIRYKEHIHDISSINSKSGYSNHILNTGYTYRTIHDTTDVITMGRNGKHLNTLERYHIYKISKDNLHMNDTYNDTHNPIFKILHKISAHTHPPSYV
jgi:diphthamide synthase subunit DPH2